MVKRQVFVVQNCVMCKEPIEQKARGRPRLTCSDACKQAHYRLKRGKPRKYLKGIAKMVEKRRSRPMMERSFNVDLFEPVTELSYRRWVYECMACGKPYMVERVKGNLRVSPYCSDACEQRARKHWRKFEDALARAGRVDERVMERWAFGKLSPLCPRCNRPFAPNTTIHGNRRPGRARKYCSDRCCREAYEHRWKVRYRRARVHRWHECPNCGKKFDRTDSAGQRRKRFCSEVCNNNFKSRARFARMSAKAAGKPEITGRRAATLRAPKNKEKRAFSNKNAGETSCGELPNG